MKHYKVRVTAGTEKQKFDRTLTVVASTPGEATRIAIKQAHYLWTVPATNERYEVIG